MHQHYLHYWLIALLGFVPLGQTVAQAKKPGRVFPTRPITLDEAVLRQAIVDSANRFVGLTERTNNNDADWITLINKANGLPSRAYYCASGYYHAHRLNGVILPVPKVSLGRVAAYFRDPAKIVYRRNSRGNQRVGRRINQADAVSLFASHIEMIFDHHYDPDTDDRVRCLGFNTTAGRGTRGGCYVNYRKTSEIKFIANWITPYLKTIQ